MNRLSIERWPERIKRLYKKYYPEDDNVTYGNLIEKIDNALKNGGGKGTVPFSNIFDCIEIFFYYVWIYSI